MSFHYAISIFAWCHVFPDNFFCNQLFSVLIVVFLLFLLIMSSCYFNCQETKATWHSADHCGILLAFLGIVRVILKLVIMKAKTQNTPRLHCNVIGDPKTIAHISHNCHYRQWRTFFQQKKAKVDRFFKVIPSLYQQKSTNQKTKCADFCRKFRHFLPTFFYSPK